MGWKWGSTPQSVQSVHKSHPGEEEEEEEEEGVRMVQGGERVPGGSLCQALLCSSVARRTDV